MPSELARVATKVAVWLERLAEHASQEQSQYASQFPGLSDSCRKDSVNYATVAKELRVALKEAADA